MVLGLPVGKHFKVRASMRILSRVADSVQLIHDPAYVIRFGFFLSHVACEKEQNYLCAHLCETARPPPLRDDGHKSLTTLTKEQFLLFEVSIR